MSKKNIYEMNQIDQGEIDSLVNSVISGVGYYQIRDDKLKTVYCSKNIPALLGYTEEEYMQIVQDDAMGVVYEPDRKRLKGFIKTSNTLSSERICSFRITHKDGHVFWIQTRMNLVKMDNQEYEYHIIFMKMSDEAMLYYTIANEATSGVYVVDKSSYKVLYMNRRMKELLQNAGVSSILGHTCYKVFRELDHSCKECILKKDPVNKVEVYIKRIKKYFSLSTHDVLWNGILASVMYVTDITEEKKAVLEITQVYNNIPGAVFQCRYDDDWTVLSANEGLYTFLGYSREEFQKMGNKMSAVIYPDDQQIMKGKIQAQLVDGNTSIENENRLICKDGSIKWISIRGQLLENEKGEKSFYCVFVNITKQKEEEQKTMAAKQNLSIALEHAKMVYWECEFSEERAYVNEATQQLFGIGPIIDNYPESYLALHFVSEEDIPIYRKNIDRIRNGLDYVEFTARVRSLKSDYEWMKLRFTGVKDESGKAVRAICTGETISEYKELENQFQTILMQNRIESWVYDITRHTLILTQGKQYSSQYHNLDEIKDIPETHIRDGFCHPDDANILRQFYQDIDNGVRQPIAILRFYNEQDKTYQWKRCTYTVIPDKDNKPVYAIGSCVDVTEHIEAKERYRKAIEFREHTQSENMLVSGHCSITKRRMLEMDDQSNANLLQRFGEDREDFYKGLCSLITDEKKRKKFKQLFLTESVKRLYELGDNQLSMECGIRFSKEQKDFRWVQIQLTMGKAPESKDLEGFLTINDVTELKRQEQILNAVLQWDYDFVANVNFTSDSLVIYHSHKTDQEFAHCKEGYSYSYRKTIKWEAKKQVIEKEREYYCKQMDPAYVKEQLRKMDIYEFIYHSREKNGELHAKRVRFTAYSEAKELVVYSRADVTEMLDKQERQKELLQKSLLEAEKANQAKSEFLSRVSHDMRTPLNGILGLTNLMKEKTDWLDIQKDLAQLEISGDYLLNLINDTLDVSKIENKKMELNPTVCAGKMVFENVLSLLKPNMDEKQIDFQVHAENIPFTMLYLDVGRIEQMIMNILGNAVKFTPRYGTIDFDMENLEDSETRVMDRIIIKDSGIGMSEEYLPHLFEPFSQENTNRTTKYQGTGLGMTITKKIIDLMGGSISVHSELGKGTTFTLILPMQKATKEQIEKNKPKAKMVVDMSILQGKRILLCEDHPLNAQIATRLLEKEGIQIEVATNGKMAVEMFENTTKEYYDLILMDIRMPIMDGLEATKIIRHLMREDAATIPIIAMTANALSEDVEACQKAGMNAHLSKPIKPNLLYETIAANLGENKR